MRLSSRFHHFLVSNNRTGQTYAQVMWEWRVWIWNRLTPNSSDISVVEILLTQPSKIKSSSFPAFLSYCLLFNLDYVLNSWLGYRKLREECYVEGHTAFFRNSVCEFDFFSWDEGNGLAIKFPLATKISKIACRIRAGTALKSNKTWVKWTLKDAM